MFEMTVGDVSKKKPHSMSGASKFMSYIYLVVTEICTNSIFKCNNVRLFIPSSF